MKPRIAPMLLTAALLAASACSTSPKPPPDYAEVTPSGSVAVPSPDPERAAAYPAARVSRGQYLVELLGCAGCHTDGALLGHPVPGLALAGSHVGIAYTNPLTNRYPGVVYPPNLTPDNQTGLGDWSDDDIVTLLTTGEDNKGHYKLPVMPWTAYSRLNRTDAYAIAAYLRSIPPVRNPVPARVSPGQKATTPYVHVGLYQHK